MEQHASNEQQHRGISSGDPSQSQSAADHHAYPRLVRELTQAEIQKLTMVLHLDNTRHLHGASHKAEIQTLIQSLPKRLRRPRPLPLGWIKKESSRLCDLHRAMNADLVLEILQLIQREVTVHFRQFDAYPQFVHSMEADLLDRLRAMKGMWTKPGTHPPVAPSPWPYQINGCPACVVARVAADQAAICDLRVVLLSRTHTRRNARQRSLSPFVDECIKRFGDRISEELFTATNHLSLRMKAARKACTRHWAHDQAREHSRRCANKRRHRGTPRAERRLDENPMSDSIADAPAGTAVSAGSAPGQVSSSPEFTRSSLYLNLLEQVSSSEPQAPKVLGHLCKNVDSVMGLYKGLASDNPYSRGTVFPGDEYESHAANPGISKERMREISFAAVNGTLDEGMRREMGQLLTSSPLPPHLSKFETHRPHDGPVDVPVVYQYSASERANSEWTDDECGSSGSEYETPPVPASPSPADTTWSLVCSRDNWI